MKQLLVTTLLPLIAAAAAWLFLRGEQQLPQKLFAPQQHEVKPADIVGKRWIQEFNGEPVLEDYLLKTGEGYENIFLFGSSELTSSSDAVSYRFVSRHFHTQVVGVGEAGNQCFSIYTQLLASAGRLKGAPVVIILSPSWFAGHDAVAGTPAEIWLKYNSPAMLQRISRDSSASEKAYFAERFAALFYDFNRPDPEHRKLFYNYQVNRNPFCKALYTPLGQALPFFTDGMSAPVAAATAPYKRSPIQTDQVHLNWDSLYEAAKVRARAAATNNTMGVNNEYYDQFVKGRRGEFFPVPRSQNREMDDFHALLRLMQRRGVNASFIILPVNLLYFKNPEALQPGVDELTTAIGKTGFPCYNMFDTDRTHFEKEMLTDVMHPGEYGWLKMTRFIIETYHLDDEKQ